MSFFNDSVPLIRGKHLHPDIYRDRELYFVDFRLGKYRFHSTFYTKIDQTCLIWGVLVIPIFGVGQFSTVDWLIQAIVWTVISLLGLCGMVGLTQSWVRSKRLSWLLHSWVILIIGGLLLTNLSIFLRCGRLLSHVCALWLILCAMGYLLSGLALRSRAFLATSLLHLVTVFFLPYVSGWQIIFTGMAIAIPLLILAEFQWDMQIERVMQ